MASIDTSLVIAKTKVVAPKEGCFTGAVINEGRMSPKWLTRFVERTQKPPKIVAFYVHWGHNFPRFPAEECDVIRNMGAIPLIVWEPDVPMTEKDGKYPLDRIINGKYDSYARQWALDAKKYQHPFLQSFGHEMNGNWYSMWDGVHNGADQTEGFGDPKLADGPERYKAAFIRVHGLFDEVGNDNATWVFCVNEMTVPSGKWNSPLSYFPGARYVDWYGINGYNWGRRNWDTFDGIFRNKYRQFVESYPKRPIIICEMSANEAGGSKPQWIRETFKNIKANYKELKAFCWFNVYRENEEVDWRINSTPESLVALNESMADPYYIGGLGQNRYISENSEEQEFMIEDFHVLTKEMFKYGKVRVLRMRTSDRKSSFLRMWGEGGGDFIGGFGKIVDQDADNLNFLEMDIKGKGKLKFELYDDDNNSGMIDQSPIEIMPQSDDLFIYNKSINYPGWTHIKIPLESFRDANPGRGDDIFSSEGGTFKKFQISASGKKVDIEVGNIKLTR